MRSPARFLAILSVTTFCALFVSGCGRTNSDSFQIDSPDGDIRISFFLDDSGTPYYRVEHRDIVAIDTSQLGFRLKHARNLGWGFKVTSSSNREENEDWSPIWGEQRIVHNHYREMVVDLAEEAQPFRRMSLVFRAYDDGIAFRYEIPKQDAIDSLIIIDERTSFKMTGNHEAWWIPGDWDIYEHLYTHSLLSEINAAPKRHNPYLAQTYIPDSLAVNTPLTMRTDDGRYLVIHEAALTDYAGMTLSIDPATLTLRSSLVAWPDGVLVRTGTPFKSPWRTVQIADEATDLIESALIVNLNEPSQLQNTEWITPIKYVGIWWEMHLGKSTWAKEGGMHGATTANAMRYIDFAAENNIQAVLIEGWNTGWEDWFGPNRQGVFDFTTPYDDFDLEQVVAYAREKNVAIIGHHETSADILTYEKQLDAAFGLYQRLGIHAVKTGYVGTILPEGYYHHGQFMVRHYRKVVETAAKYQIMIDAHEPIKDTGIRRTWPNMMTREGLRGQEFNAWSDMNPPEHTTIIPYTRMLAGPIDFTPGIFDIKFDQWKPDNQVNTTLAKQLALYVVIYSPFQMAADLPENYENQPAFQFIRDVAVDWDETLALNGSIGEYVTIARREKGTDNWFLGSISNAESRKLAVHLDFLNPEIEYLAEIYADGPEAHWDFNPVSIRIEKRKVTAASILDIDLAPGGGQAIYFHSQ